MRFSLARVAQNVLKTQFPSHLRSCCASPNFRSIPSTIKDEFVSVFLIPSRHLTVRLGDIADQESPVRDQDFPLAVISPPDNNPRNPLLTAPPNKFLAPIPFDPYVFDQLHLQEPYNFVESVDGTVEEPAANQSNLSVVNHANLESSEDSTELGRELTLPKPR